MHQFTMVQLYVHSCVMKEETVCVGHVLSKAGLPELMLGQVEQVLEQDVLCLSWSLQWTWVSLWSQGEGGHNDPLQAR